MLPIKSRNIININFSFLLLISLSLSLSLNENTISITLKRQYFMLMDTKVVLFQAIVVSLLYDRMKCSLIGIVGNLMLPGSIRAS